MSFSAFYAENFSCFMIKLVILNAFTSTTQSGVSLQGLLVISCYSDKLYSSCYSNIILLMSFIRFDEKIK